MVPQGLIENRVNRAVPTTIADRRNPNASSQSLLQFKDLDPRSKSP